MEVTTCGKTFNTDRIAGCQAAGAALTFGELTALEIAKAASSRKRELVVLPASREIVLTHKLADGCEVVLATLDPKATPRSIAWDRLEGLAEAEQERDAALTKAQAVIKAMDSAAGAPFTELYRHPDSALTVLQWLTRQETAAKRGASTSARAEVDNRIAAVMTANAKLSRSQAMIQVIDADPGLAQRYRAEQTEQ